MTQQEFNARWPARSAVKALEDQQQANEPPPAPVTKAGKSVDDFRREAFARALRRGA